MIGTREQIIAAAERAGMIFDPNYVGIYVLAPGDVIQLYIMPDGMDVWNVMVENNLVRPRMWSQEQIECVQGLRCAIHRELEVE